MLRYQSWCKPTASFSPASVTISQLAPKQLALVSLHSRITCMIASANSTRRRSFNSLFSLLTSSTLARTSKSRRSLRWRISEWRKVALETRRKDFRWWCGTRLRNRWCRKDQPCRPSSRFSSTFNRSWLNTWQWEGTKRMEQSNRWNCSNL